MIETTDISDPIWFAGFVSRESNFEASIRKYTDI